MNPTERQDEIQYLDQILQEIRSQLALSNEAHCKSRADLDQSLSHYWEHTHADFWDEAQFVETVARERSITAASYQRQRQLLKLLDSPYFGRIDFAEETPSGPLKPAVIYIGAATLSEQTTKELLVYDWRSPIAGLFYDFERGPASYLCPAGRIDGIITLKRQYKIVHGHLEYVFDSDLKIDDELLQAILSQSADPKMRTIITSIQREQNRVIRDDHHSVLFVQGPAGSGKTSIALHRAAYLLYRDRHRITSRNILIFSPNRIFSDYIANVLPELGEENVAQTTFQDYLWRGLADFPLAIESRDAQLEYLYHGPNGSDFDLRIAGIRYKSAARFMTVIQNYLTKILDQIRHYPTVRFLDQIIIAQTEWDALFSKDLSYLPITKRLTHLKKLIQKRMRPIIHQLRLEEAKKIAAAGEEVNERVINALARINVRRHTEQFVAEITRRTELNCFTLYRRLYENATLFQSLSGDSEVPPEWPAICDLTLNALDQGQIFYEDALALLFFKGMMDGFPIKPTIRQLIIDEAQDYTLLQYEIIRQLFPKSAWTILGDPAQSIHPYLESADFQSAAQLWQDEPGSKHSPVIIRLTKSYRSTREIQQFTAALLNRPPEAEPIHRPGVLPQLIFETGPELLAARIQQSIDELIQEGHKSIAVICKTLREAGQAYDHLKNRLPIHLITPEISELQAGNVIIPAYLAKGLEFDAVLVYNADATVYGKETDRHILYTVCTRALHRLVLYARRESSPFIQAMEPRLYQSL